MTDSAHLDKVAAAICRAEPDNTELSDEFVRAVMADYADYYRRMAQAAIDALQLTEEWGYQLDGEDAAAEPDAWFPADEYNTSRPVSHQRLVSGWVRVDGGDA